MFLWLAAPPPSGVLPVLRVVALLMDFRRILGSAGSPARLGPAVCSMHAQTHTHTDMHGHTQAYMHVFMHTHMHTCAGMRCVPPMPGCVHTRVEQWWCTVSCGGVYIVEMVLFG